MAGRLLTTAFGSYSRQLKQNPWRTQIVTTGVLWAAGDVLAQRFEKGPFDPRRCALTAMYGAAFVGPVGHTWYIALDRAARAVLKPGSAAFIGAKVVADTAIFGPIHVAGYFTYMTALEGGGMQEMADKLRRDFWPTFSAELFVWPFVQAVNFKMVPVEFQLLVVNSFTILDASFMSWTRSNDGWFPRYFPALAERLGMEAVEAGSSSGGQSSSGHGHGSSHSGHGSSSSSGHGAKGHLQHVIKEAKI